MLNTVKSKIIAITISMLFVLSLILGFFAYVIYRNGKILMTQGCDFTVSTFVESINKDVNAIENNAMDLALMGEIYYKTNKVKSIAEYIVANTFEMYENSLGGGIWFEPYVVFPNKKLNCTYAYRSKSDKIIIDKTYETEDFNYLNKSWYKEIKSRLYTVNSVAWSMPYFEEEGSDTVMVSAGSGIYNDNDELIGISTVDWALNAIIFKVMRMQPTPNSFALFADKVNDYVFVSTDIYKQNSMVVGKSLKEIPWYNDDLKDMSTFEYHGKKYICYYKTLDNGMILIINVPEAELLSLIINHVIMLLILLIFVSTSMAVILYIVLNNNIKRPIDKLISIANTIGQGQLDTQIQVEKPEEFAKLANTFDKMTKDIKEFITNLNIATQEKEKIESELMVAQTIQYSTLPNVFPPYPNRNEFNIYALMETAKEVGGDFYDFYFIGRNKFMFLIADVSGKGIPAALFMMTTKTLVKNFAEMGYEPKELIQKVNEKVCADNKQGFFVTLFAGIINLNNGDMTCLNCGHTPPLLRRSDGKYEYLHVNPNLVLGIEKDTDFEVFKTKFEPGDSIFIYTDGLTDAVNSDGDMYGEERLCNAINDYLDYDFQNRLLKVKDNIKNFAGEEPPADDMTMLIFEYNGKPDIFETKTFKTIAKNENFKKVRSWLAELSKEWEIDKETVMKLELSAEEIFTNIAFYAYEDSPDGTVEISCTRTADELSITFADKGVPYNPLERPDPDISLPEELRAIGGLGVYMVKKSSNSINYEYINGKNILTIIFSIE